MKTLVSIFFVLTSMGYNTIEKQEVETVTATFVEFVDDTYYFIDKDDYSLEFQQIEKAILNTYNLNDDSQKGKTFKITFETDTQEDEEGDFMQITIITELKLVE